MKGYYLCDLSEMSHIEKERELAVKLYDWQTHNLITFREIIEKIIDFYSCTIEDCDISLAEDCGSIIYHDDEYILTYDSFDGTYTILVKAYRLADNQISSILNGKITPNHVGTNYSERMDIANKVIAENGEQMIIRIGGEIVKLHLEMSKSKITKSYLGEISQDLFKQYYQGKLAEGEKSFAIFINADMTITLTYWSRKTANSTWKQRYWLDIDNANVEILKEEI